jgi:predicted phage tail protein
MSNGSPITDYVIQRSEGTRWITIRDGVSAKRSAVVSRLTYGARYSFRVAAVNGLGRGPWSSIVRATPKGKPSAPTKLRAVAGTGRVSLAWNAPTLTGGSRITDYVIQIATGQRWSTVRDRVSTARTRLISRLINGTAYRFRVAARNAVGQGPRSSIVRATPRL